MADRSSPSSDAGETIPLATSEPQSTPTAEAAGSSSPASAPVNKPSPRVDEAAIDAERKEAVAEAYDRRIRTVTPLACVLLVTLRLFIGWQFLYEGLWKHDTQTSANPWTAEGYLANARGPFRDVFREMAGDPDGLGWLDYDTVAGRWDRFAFRFDDHYQLDEDQSRQLAELLNGVKQFKVELPPIRPLVELYDASNRSSWARKLQEVSSYDGSLIVDGDKPLLPSEIAYLKSLVPLSREADGTYTRPNPRGGDPLRDSNPRRVGAVPAEIEYYRGLEKLESLQADNLGYKRKLRAALSGDPDRLGVTGQLQTEDGAGVRYAPAMGTIDRERESAEQVIIRYGEQQIYRDLLEQYEQLLSNRSLEFPEAHAAALIGKVRAKKREVIGPIEKLDSDFREAAADILTSEQYAAGAVPAERTPLKQSSDMAMYALLVLGTLLIVGFLTPIAALAGAGMLLSFYLVWPPWPGVPDAPGPEHSLIVDKNLIEVVALLAIAACPTGRWFGLDGLLARLFRRSPKPAAV